MTEEFTAPEVTDDDHVRGPGAAAVTVIEYGDYECPYCRGAARDVHLLLDEYPGSIRFVFRNFPIPQLHPHAEQAAEAAEASAAQGKFWEMYELLLRPTARLDQDSLLGYAERLDLNTGRFLDDLAGETYAARVQRDVREGIQNGVNSTPKFYVNARRIDGHLPLEGLTDAVRAEVADLTGPRNYTTGRCGRCWGAMSLGGRSGNASSAKEFTMPSETGSPETGKNGAHQHKPHGGDIQGRRWSRTGRELAYVPGS